MRAMERPESQRKVWEDTPAAVTTGSDGDSVGAGIWLTGQRARMGSEPPSGVRVLIG